MVDTACTTEKEKSYRLQAKQNWHKPSLHKQLILLRLFSGVNQK